MLQATWLRVGRACRRGADRGRQRGRTASWSPSSCGRSARRCRRILLEPVGRNTAPAIAAAALQALADGGDPLLLVLPSDHVVARCRRVPRRGARGVAGGRATARWSPSASCRTRRKPASATSRPTARASGVRKVLRFVEKPDAATAQQYLDAGGYYWNSGMFLFRASRVPGRTRSASAPTSSLRAARRSTQRQARRRLRAPRRRCVRRLSVGFDRLRGDGEAPTRRWCCRSTSAGTMSVRGRRCGT